MSAGPEHEPGTFCWADVTTTDQEGAKAFYGGLFGWEADDRPVGDGIYYSMMRLEGEDVAAISPQPPQQREAGVPPLWNSYVSVESADAVAGRAAELGGTVHAQPFDVLDAGRMAVIQDPQGAFLMAWEPRAHRGAGLMRTVGALCWNELVTSDLDAAAEFYSDLFGWTVTESDQEAIPYRFLHRGEAPVGGMRISGHAEIPTHWAVYLGASDAGGATLAEAERLGGTRIADPLEISVGTIAPLRDPQGAGFLLYTPNDLPG